MIGLKNGDSKPEVRLIKERLRAEGFWGEEDSEAYGPKLTEAVKLYQYTHQVWEKGIITDARALERLRFKLIGRIPA